MKIWKNGQLEEVTSPGLNPVVKEKRELRKRFGPAGLEPHERERINANRRPDGTFMPGTSGFPGGSVRKAREDRYFIDAMKAAFENLGGVAGLTAWAERRPTEFYRLMGKMIPVQVSIEKETGDRTFIVKHALPAPRYSNQPDGVVPEQGMVIEMVNPDDLSTEDIRKAIAQMDAAEKAELLASLGAATAHEDA